MFLKRWHLLNQNGSRLFRDISMTIVSWINHWKRIMKMKLKPTRYSKYFQAFQFLLAAWVYSDWFHFWLPKGQEVGVRKVLGASAQNIVYLFSKDFVILIILAFIISIPITWYTMEGWLADFAYKINLSPIYFIIGISVTLFIALLTIGYQSIKVAIANPVNSLRSE